MKTIKKLGFTVSAVWNGKEALEYLLAAESPNPPHWKPDIILMDVQMPVIDGYRATHVIRHHSPYRLSHRNIPIVAMTASAIQGDREKCERAGMDDYLAKPVKGKALEKMIVKWAISRRTSITPGGSEYESSECSDSEEHNCRTGSFPKFEHAAKATPRAMAEARPTLSERQNSQRLTLPGTESEGDRAERRNEAEEMALHLRDEKLVDAAGGPRDGHVPHNDDSRDIGQQLTRENVGKLQQEHDSSDATGWPALKKGAVGGSTGVERGSSLSYSTDLASIRSGERPRRDRRWHDSQRTITGNEK